MILSTEPTHNSIGPPPTDVHYDWLRHQRNSSALHHPLPRATLAGPRRARLALPRPAAVRPAPALRGRPHGAPPAALALTAGHQRSCRAPSAGPSSDACCSRLASTAPAPAAAPAAGASSRYLPGGSPTMPAHRARRAAPALRHLLPAAARRQQRVAAGHYAIVAGHPLRRRVAWGNECWEEVVRPRSGSPRGSTATPQT